MENGGVDTTVIDSRQHQMGLMADFPPLLPSSVFDLSKQDVHQIKSQTIQHALMNLVDKLFLKKTCGPIIGNEHLWVCTKFMCLQTPISLLSIQNSVQVPTLHYSVQDSTCKQHFQMFLRVLTSLQPSSYILKCIIDGTYK